MNHTNPIGSRLKLEMKKRGITSTELARRADVLTSFLYDIISGKSSNPSIIKLARVADALGVSLTYLVRGVAENTTATTHDAVKENYITIPHIALNNSTNTVDSLIPYKADSEPYYFNSEWIRNHLDTNISDLRMLTISGDSMEPTLCHQDVVIIDTSKKTPSPPSIFILFDGFGLSAKRLEYVSETKNPRIRIISDNPHYSTYECSISDVTIIGRVVWFSREI